MDQYNYTVKDKQGVARKGLIEAPSEKQAVSILHEKGFTVLTLKKKSKGFEIPLFKGIGIGPLSQFTRQLATMVTSGLPLTDALEVLEKQTDNKNLNAVIKEIAADIQGGNTFASALDKHENVFSKAYVNVIKAGEASGTLDKVLLKLADTQEKDREFQSRIKGAFIYPIIIVVAMTFVAAGILIFVVPKLSEVYSDLDISLPLPTIILIGASNFLINFWWLVIILGFATYVGLKRYKKTPSGALVLDSMALKAPIFGKLNRDSSLTQFTRTLGSLVAAGVPILEALKISGETASNAVHRKAVAEVAKQVEKGVVLSKAITVSDVFPPIIPQMITVGEETGKMDEVLEKVANYFDLEVEHQTKNLTTALEPLIMLALGVMVGLLMIAIILPIYSLTQAF